VRQGNLGQKNHKTGVQGEKLGGPMYELQKDGRVLCSFFPPLTSPGKKIRELALVNPITETCFTSIENLRGRGLSQRVNENEHNQPACSIYLPHVRILNLYRDVKKKRGALKIFVIQGGGQIKACGGNNLGWKL